MVYFDNNLQNGDISSLENTNATHFVVSTIVPSRFFGGASAFTVVGDVNVKIVLMSSFSIMMKAVLP